jgi:hypothetical protein
VAVSALVALLCAADGPGAEWTRADAVGIWLFGALPGISFVAVGVALVVLDVLDGSAQRGERNAAEERKRRG